MRVLVLCVFPVEAAATRFRVEQFVEPLRGLGIDLDVRPFLDRGQFRDLYRRGGLAAKALSVVLPVLRRFRDVVQARTFDVVFVQREAMFFGPGLIEWLIARVIMRPIVLDLDDATYVSYVSPTYGRLGSALKFFGKTDNLIRRAAVVICGNRFIADYAASLGARTVVIPTVVDLEEFHPREERAEGHIPVIGWIGTHSTFPFLETVFPVLQRLAGKHRFVLRIVGSCLDKLEVEGVDVQLIDWDLEREPEDFGSIDIGLYPVAVSASANPEWIKGKSGFKAIQYMAVGVPFVMSPVGVCAEIGEPGKTHFNADSEDDWYNSLDRLLTDRELRSAMGVAGRKHAEDNYGVEINAEVLARTLLDPKDK